MRVILAVLRHLCFAPLAAEPGRAAATIAAVAAAVAVVVGLAEVNQTIVRSFDDGAMPAVDIVEVRARSEAGLDDDTFAQLADQPALVRRAVGRLERPALMTIGAETRRVLVLGVDLLAEPSQGGTDADLAIVDDPEAVLVPASLGLALGDHLRLRAPAGERDLHVVKVLSESRRDVLVLGLDAAQLLFDRRGTVDAIAVTLVPGAKPADAVAPLRAVLGARADVTAPGERGQQLARTTAAIRAALLLESGLSVLVTLLLAYQATSMAVAARRRTVGVVRACGARALHVRLAFVGEALVLALAGGALGVLAGHALAVGVVASLGANLTRVYGASATAAPVLDGMIALRGVAIGAVAMVLGSLAPAASAAAAPIASLRGALRSTTADVRGLAIGGAVLAALLASAAIVLARHGDAAVVAGFLAVGLLAPGSYLAVTALARASIGRLSPAALVGVVHGRAAFGRNALACAALAVGLGLSVAIGTYTASYEHVIEEWARVAVPADLLVTSGSPVLDREALTFETTAALEDSVTAATGALSVSRVRTTVVTVASTATTVLAVDARAYLALREERGGLRVLARDPMLRDVFAPGRAIVSEGFAARTGKRPGDTIDLPAPDGPRAVTISAVIADYSSDQGWMLVDLADWRVWMQDARTSALALRLAPGADVDACAANLRKALATDGAGWFVTSHAEVKTEILRAAQRTLGLSRAGEYTLLFVALVALACAVGASMLERRGELSLLVRIGGEARHVVVAALAEALFIALGASIAGVTGGAVLACVLLDGVGFAATGWSVALAFPLGRIALVLGAFIAAALVTVTPLAASAARRSALS